MKKKQAIFTIVACSIAVLVLTAVLSVGLRYDKFGIDALKRQAAGEPAVAGKYRNEYTWDPDETDVVGLDVEWINGSVDVKVGSGRLIRIVEESDEKLKEEEQLVLSSSGGVLKIKWRNELISFSLFHNTYKNLTVEVPAKVAKELEVLTCNNTSGPISVVDFSAEKLKIATASGDVTVSGLTCETGEFTTASGTLNVSECAFREKLSATTVSGAMNLTGMAAGEVKCDTVSGRTWYHGTADSFDGGSVSGLLLAELEKCPKKAKLNSVSGNLILAIPKNSGFEAAFDSVSGKFSSEFETEGGSGKSGRARCGTGAASFEFSTTSGDMKVEILQ